MNTSLKANRYQASAVHLLLSILVFSALVAVMYWFWYPGKLFFMDGGWQGLKLVAMVDLVLGPALTLIVFNPAKKSLKFDLAMIALLQIGALAYGFYATYQQRPVAIVYTEGAFTTLSHSDYQSANEQLRAKQQQPQSIDAFGPHQPVVVYTTPHNDITFSAYLESILNDYPEQRERSDEWFAVSEKLEELQTLALDQPGLQAAGLAKYFEVTAQSDRFVEQTYAAFPFAARYANGYTVMDLTTGELVEFIDAQQLEATPVATSDATPAAATRTATSESD